MATLGPRAHHTCDLYVALRGSALPHFTSNYLSPSIWDLTYQTHLAPTHQTLIAACNPLVCQVHSENAD